jgi:hypothetical protein
MLPPDWGRPHSGPRRLPFAKSGAALRERYQPLGRSRQLDRVFANALDAGATAVFLDRPYIDLDYRSDLSHFYGRAFRPPPPATERLIFTTENEVLGTAVIRPLPQQVGRTLLPPPAREQPYVTCTAEMPVHAFGFHWSASGYPFTSQDGEYGVCAHAAIWSVARYHHLRFGTDRYTTSGIIEAAGLRERPDKTSRSDGLYAFDVVRAFRGIGLPALQYDVASIPETSEGTETAHSVIQRYLNSAIPVAVLTSEHMMVIIGYGRDSDGQFFYIVSDDNYGAYERSYLVTGIGADAWRMFVIPQPGRMHVNGEAAEARAQQAFEDRIRAEEGPGQLLARWMKEEISTRTYATPSTTYLEATAERDMPQEIRQHHIYAPKGNWIWVTEFHDPDSTDGSVLGEIAVDATSLQLDPSPIFGNIDGWGYVWHEGQEEPSLINLAPGARFQSALGDPSEIPWDGPPAFSPFAGTAVR